MKKLLSAAAVVALLALVFILWRRDRGNSTSDTTAAPGSAESKIEPPKSKFPSPAVAIPGLAQELNSPTHDIRADLQLVATLIETYRTNFLREGNPTGNNAEITAALTGENKLNLVLLPRTHPAINRRGELCDRWGTPFFFHAESGTHMEIHSAGPDRKFHTPDDVVLSP